MLDIKKRRPLREMSSIMNQTLNPRVVGTAATIADLQSMLGTFSTNDEADVAGYYSARDGGGGSFFFEGTPPPSAMLKNATLATKTITGATSASPMVITAAGHGFTTGQSILISGVAGINANGKWLITVIDADTFSLNGSTGNGTWSSGGTPQATSITVTTSAAHGFVSGVQAMIAGVQGMPGINATWAPIGLIGSATTFTIPASASAGAGSYLSGGLVGDGGGTIPSAVVNGRWLRSFDAPGHFHFQDFGGVPDWNGTSTPGTDNLAVMNTVLAAIHAEANKSAKIILRGWLYFSDTITITRGVVIEGTGMSDPVAHLGGPGDRVAPGTWLGFPQNKTAFRIKGGSDREPEGFTSSAWFSTFRDLTISCKDSGTSSGYGVHATAPICMYNVIVGWFGGANVFLDGNTSLPLIKNPSGSVFTNCLFWFGKSEGILLSGIDARVCLIQGCFAIGNNVGFRDMTGYNIYVACHGEGNAAKNYLFEGVGNNSSLHGCYSEDEDRASLTAWNDVFGGTINSGPHFDIICGVMRGRPLQYENRRGEVVISTQVGEDYSTKAMVFGEMAVYKPSPPAPSRFYKNDSLRWRFLGPSNSWITLDSWGTGLEVLRLPTFDLKLRRSAPYNPNGIYLGKPPAQMAFQAGPSPEPSAPNAFPQIYEKGDTIWKSDPSAGGIWAQRCVTAGTLRDIQPATMPKGTVSMPGMLVVSSPMYLAVGQYISVDGLDAGETKKITEIRDKNVTYTPASGTVGAEAAIKFVPPVFEKLYAANGPSVTTAPGVTLTADQRFVTVTAAGTINLPKSPFDGQTHEIKGKGAFTVTIAGNGANVEGAASYTQSTNRSNTRVRFNSATGEWEIR